MAVIASTIWKSTRFATDAAGLEKTLRLLQALAQITSFYLPTEDAVPWLVARRQFALGRRYLRFFKFTDAFSHAHVHFLTSSSNLASLLETGKYSCLGLYLFLESCNILDAMGVYNTHYGPRLLFEANRFWFYSLCLSLVLSAVQLYQLFADTSSPLIEEKTLRSGKAVKAIRLNDGEKVRVRDRIARRQGIVKKVVTDACDLLVPGSIVGWLPVSAVTVGMATVVSTVLGSGEIWDRVR